MRKGLLFLLLTFVAGLIFVGGCSKGLPSADEMNQRRQADDAKRLGESGE